MRWVALFFSLAVCFGVSAVGARWTTGEIPTWYRTLVRPSFAPPNWVFGPVWTLLYLLMAVAVWRVWLSTGPLRTQGLWLFAVQLAFNLAWSWIFFRKHAMGAALVEIVVLWALIGATTLVFARVDTIAAWLMTPYWAWVTFASVLNGAYWRLNGKG